MKIVQNIAGALLGLLFVFAAVSFFMMDELPKPPEGTPMAMFAGAFIATGYMTLVKVLELIGGVLVAIPRTRALGLLIIVPILVNIVAYHIFVTAGEGLVGIPVVAAVIAIFLIWSHRRGILSLIADRG